MIEHSSNTDLQRPLNLIDDHFLSAITTLFIEEAATDHRSLPLLGKRNHLVDPVQRHANTSIATLPCSKQTEAIALKEYGTRKAEPNHIKRRSRPDRTGETIRTFILGLSDAFNNLLMGIWGNVTLISHSVDKSGTAVQSISEMENIIQSGSALINAVFGYLGERRIVAKNIRLNQLVQEINGVLPFVGDRIKREILNASLTASESKKSGATLASNLSRMLKPFVECLQHQYNLILMEENLTEDILARLHILAGLMDRAREILVALNHYAGTEPLNIKKTSAKAMIAKLVGKFKQRFPQLNISLDLAPRLPWIHADRTQLKFVLNQLLENATHAMARRGNLHIEAKALKSEPARSRCVAHRWSDSIAITVSDTGHGMDLKTLLHIFDPFFTGRRTSGRLGMGLAASWGIIKAHGGYIHVHSKLGHGSSYKLYLPVAS